MAMAVSKAQRLEWRLVLVLPLLNCFPPWPPRKLATAILGGVRSAKSQTETSRGLAYNRRQFWGCSALGNSQKVMLAHVLWSDACPRLQCASRHHLTRH